MDQVPTYVSVVFMITTFVTVGIFLYGASGLVSDSLAARAVLFLIPFWMIFQFFVARAGYYTNTSAFPPRLFLFGVLPSLGLVIGLLLFARENFVSKLPLTVLTIVHVVRIPVELTLAWLYDAGAVPRIMTFHGNNFDILSGITAPLALYLALRKDSVGRSGLIIWNVAALLLVFNIVITAIFCVPSPIQQLGFDQPNVGVLYAPFIWLPTVVVPTVFFSHFASLYILLSRRSIHPLGNSAT